MTAVRLAQDLQFVLVRLLAVFAIGAAALFAATLLSPAMRAARANLWTRVATWVAITVGLVAAAWAGGWVLAAVSATIGLLAGRELLRAGRLAFPATASFVLFCFVAVPWIAAPLWLLNDLRAWDGGFLISIWILMTVAIADVAGMYGGMAVGRHRPFPGLSGGKTVEGYAAAMLGGLAAAAAVLPGLPAAAQPGAATYFAASALVVVAGAGGDLAASALKRRAGIKDFGRALPGHGGVMDRLDSLLFALPTGWLAVLCFWP